MEEALESDLNDEVARAIEGDSPVAILEAQSQRDVFEDVVPRQQTMERNSAPRAARLTPASAVVLFAPVPYSFVMSSRTKLIGFRET
jgi:hypothetical protein